MLSKTLNSGRAQKQETSSLTERIYEALLQNIVMGEFPHGEFLSELSLAERFKASPTPIREGLHSSLSGRFFEGFPPSRIRRGGYRNGRNTGPLSIAQNLEPEAAALAAQNSPGEAFFDTCTGILKDQARAMSGERSYELFLESSGIEYQFHHTIALGSGNKSSPK